LSNKIFCILIILAIAFKVALFSFAVISCPESKLQIDSDIYLKTSRNLLSKGSFALSYSNGRPNYEKYRTPGYPLFLGTLNSKFKIPLNGVLAVQILLTMLSGFIVYKTAFLVDGKIAKLSMLIVLFDPPSSVFSLMILTESLFMLLMALFMYLFVKYIKYGKINLLCLSAVVLSASVYTKPIAYYLIVPVVMFLVYLCWEKGWRTVVKHVLVFVLIVCVLIGLWHYRNVKRFNDNRFSSISNATLQLEGLFGSYSRNKDPYTMGMKPVPYYISVTTRCFMSLMTRPVPFKYFKSDVLKVAGKVFCYPWIVFWIIGFIGGIAVSRKNIYIQFLLVVVLYFVVATVGGAMWGSGPRFRVPMVPFIAIVSAYGWSKISSLKNK